MTRTVFFDVGCVLIVSPWELVPRAETRLGLPEGALRLYGPFDPAADPDWREVVAGMLDEDGYWSRQAERLAPVVGCVPEARALIEVLFAPESEETIVRREVVSLAEELRAAGVRVGILSNHLGLFHRPQAMASTLAGFDPVLDLSFAPHRKPHPAAFAWAAERLGGLPPGEVTLVDDQPANVAGAAAAGWRAVAFDPVDPAGSCDRVRKEVLG